MIIMFIAPGRSIHSNNWASAMCDRGHTVHFVTQESFIDNPYSFVVKADSRIIIHRLPFSGKKGFLLNRSAVRSITKKINPDVIHVHQAAGYGLLGTYSDREKAFLSVYGWEVYDLVNSKVWKPVIGYILKWYKHIGSTSECMKKQILKEFPDLKAPVVVTPFGIDLNKFHEKTVKKQEFIIGTVKKMDKKYGIEYLIQAFADVYKEINKSDPEIAERLFLELVGPGKQIDSLKALARDLQIYSRVRFIGKTTHEKVPDWLNRFDIYVAPSILDSESFGVAVIEASACRKPVIVSNVGGLPEVVKDGVTGYIVRARNSGDIAEKIMILLKEPELRKKMGIAGEALVRERYDWKRCIDLMEKIYRSIIEKTYVSVFAAAKSGEDRMTGAIKDDD